MKWPARSDVDKSNGSQDDAGQEATALTAVDGKELVSLVNIGCISEIF